MDSLSRNLFFASGSSTGAASGTLNYSDFNSLNGVFDVSLLLHYDGANNSTTFTDSSLRNLSVTPFGGAQISTTKSKFNNSSGYFNGTTNYLRIPYNQYFNASQEFTLETWFNADALSGIIIAKDKAGFNFDWCIQIVSATQLRCYSNGTATNLTVTVPTMSTGTWYHVALVRRNISGTLTNTFYLDGVAYGSNTMSISDSSQEYFSIGCASWNSPNSFFAGYLDDTRISKKAVYSANFTPSGPFSDPSVPISDISFVSIDDTNNGIYLTNATGLSVGNLWFKTLRPYNSNFTVEWIFECSGGSGADGFVLQWGTNSSEIGQTGNACGLIVSPVNAIKFATVPNPDTITFSTQVENSQLASPYWRQNVYYWAEYIHASSQMRIYYSLTSTKPASPNHIFNSFSFGSTSYYMGFGASTGAFTDNHILKRWIIS